MGYDDPFRGAAHDLIDPVSMYILHDLAVHYAIIDHGLKRSGKPSEPGTFYKKFGFLYFLHSEVISEFRVFGLKNQ